MLLCNLVSTIDTHATLKRCPVKRFYAIKSSKFTKSSGTVSLGRLVKFQTISYEGEIIAIALTENKETSYFAHDFFIKY